MNQKLLELLRCPVSGQSLRLLSDEELGEVNTRISDGLLSYGDKTPVTETIESGIITADKARIYKVESDIPVMVQNQSIPVSDL